MESIGTWCEIGVNTVERWADKIKPYAAKAFIFPFAVFAVACMSPFILIGFCVDMKERWK